MDSESCPCAGERQMSEKAGMLREKLTDGKAGCREGFENLQSAGVMEKKMETTI